LNQNVLLLVVSNPPSPSLYLVDAEELEGVRKLETSNNSQKK